MRRRHFLTASAVAAGALLAGLPARAAAPAKIGFVHPGPVADHGRAFQIELGRRSLAESFGDRIEIVLVEPATAQSPTGQPSAGQPHGGQPGNGQPDYGQIFARLADSGAGLVFVAVPGHSGPAAAAAEAFPDMRFEILGGTRTSDNVSIYNGRFYEARAVTGHIAGRMTTSNRIGYIAPSPTPGVLMGINAAFLQARRANPEVELSVVWTFSRFDPARETDAALALLREGCDVIMQHTGSSAPVQVAEEHGVWCIGQDSDMAAFGPTRLLTSIVDNWAPYYLRRTQAHLDGSWAPESGWGELAGRDFALAPLSDAVPVEVRAEAEALVEAIASGELHPFTGPIRRQDGLAWLADGETAADTGLLGMDFYVEGITGDIPA